MAVYHLSKRARFASAFTGSVLCFAALPAKAQDAQDASPTVLENIVVQGGSGGVIQADGYVGKSSATGAKTDTPFFANPAVYLFGDAGAVGRSQRANAS